MLKRLVPATLVFAAFASSAFAQANFGAVPSSRQGIYENGTQNTLLRQDMNNDAKSDVTPAQRRRAQKAVAMIKDNHCQDAYDLALAEQDNRLALNIAVACKARLRQ
jgi:hypothetical protein